MFVRVFTDGYLIAVLAWMTIVVMGLQYAFAIVLTIQDVRATLADIQQRWERSITLS